ncbi:hypothetical protein SAMN05442782_2895 [Streptomyces sp. OK228]|nr:hypothetical protein SAMN05442782_2895 [Streptomyces sp. OK228]
MAYENFDWRSFLVRRSEEWTYAYDADASRGEQRVRARAHRTVPDAQNAPSLGDPSHGLTPSSVRGRRSAQRPERGVPRRLGSSRAERQVRTWPSAVSRVRSQVPQKGRVTEARPGIGTVAPVGERDPHAGGDATERVDEHGCGPLSLSVRRLSTR